MGAHGKIAALGPRQWPTALAALMPETQAQVKYLWSRYLEDRTYAQQLQTRSEVWAHVAQPWLWGLGPVQVWRGGSPGSWEV